MRQSSESRASTRRLLLPPARPSSDGRTSTTAAVTAVWAVRTPHRAFTFSSGFHAIVYPSLPAPSRLASHRHRRSALQRRCHGSASSRQIGPPAAFDFGAAVAVASWTARGRARACSAAEAEGVNGSAGESPLWMCCVSVRWRPAPRPRARGMGAATWRCNIRAHRDNVLLRRANERGARGRGFECVGQPLALLSCERLALYVTSHARPVPTTVCVPRGFCNSDNAPLELCVARRGSACVPPAHDPKWRACLDRFQVSANLASENATAVNAVVRPCGGAAAPGGRPADVCTGGARTGRGGKDSGADGATTQVSVSKGTAPVDLAALPLT